MLWNLFFTIFCDIIASSYIDCIPVEAIIYKANPSISEKFQFPSRKLEKRIKLSLQLSPKELQSANSFLDGSNRVLQIEPSDAIIQKFSQPIADNPNFSSYNKFSMEVPWHGMKEAYPILQHQKAQPIDKSKFDISQFETNYTDPTVKNFRKDFRYLDKSTNIDSMLPKATVLPILQASQLYESSNQHDVYVKRELPVLNRNVHNRKNFTDSSESLEFGFSGTVKSYEPNFDYSGEKEVVKDSLSANANSELTFRSSAKNSVKQMYNSSDSYLSSISDAFEHFSSEDLSSPNAILEKHSTLSDQFNFTGNEIFIEYTTGSSQLNNENTSESISSHKNMTSKISSGVVAGIVIAILVSITALSSAVIYLLYRKFHGKCGSIVENKFNSDNCAYLDDSLHSSMYLNNHIELPKESSEEMTSLDNDSFLNSLETMTIQNYWADTSKNTKV